MIKGLWCEYCMYVKAEAKCNALPWARAGRVSTIVSRHSDGTYNDDVYGYKCRGRLKNGEWMWRMIWLGRRWYLAEMSCELGSGQEQNDYNDELKLNLELETTPWFF